jgi:hypothetical protein
MYDKNYNLLVFIQDVRFVNVQQERDKIRHTSFEIIFNDKGPHTL